MTPLNIIVDVLGGYSRDVRKALTELVGDKSDTIALQIQKSVITSSLNIAKRFKLLDIRRFIIIFYWPPNHCIGYLGIQEFLLP